MLNDISILNVFFDVSLLLFVAQVTETRTGPLGCSNYDNLDSVSSVLVQSPENKVHLQGSNLCSLLFCVLDVMLENHSFMSSNCVILVGVDLEPVL